MANVKASEKAIESVTKFSSFREFKATVRVLKKLVYMHRGSKEVDITVLEVAIARVSDYLSRLVPGYVFKSAVVGSYSKKLATVHSRFLV